MKMTTKSVRCTEGIAAALLCLLLVGCVDHDKPMTPQQMADAVAECKKLGLETESRRDLSINIVRITCSPR